MGRELLFRCVFVYERSSKAKKIKSLAELLSQRPLSLQRFADEDEQKQEIKEAFDLFDTDGSGEFFRFGSQQKTPPGCHQISAIRDLFFRKGSKHVFHLDRLQSLN